MGQVTDALMGLNGPIIYVIAAVLVFAEAAMFFGFVFPGETAIVIAGVLASQHKVSLPVLLVIVVVAAIVGDSVGYEIGRRYGDRVLDVGPLRKHRVKIGKAQAMLRRRGPLAVFIGRFTAVLRALMPALAGSAKIPYPRFLTFNALGGLVWGVGYTTGGYVVGTAFEHVAKLLGRLIAIVVVVVAIVVIVVWSLRRRRREHATETAEAEAAEAETAEPEALEAPEPEPDGGAPETTEQQPQPTAHRRER